MMSLPKLGIKGNSHMLMQDKNNLQLADLILAWIDKHVEARRRGGERQEMKRKITRRELGALAAAAMVVPRPSAACSAQNPRLRRARARHRRVELPLVRRRARDAGSRHRVQRHADVCRALDSRAGAASLSGGADPRRLRAGLGLDQHSRRPARLGHAASRTGLQGLRGRPAGPGPQSLSSVCARAFRSRKRRRSKRREARSGGMRRCNDPAVAQLVASMGQPMGNNPHHAERLAHARSDPARRHRSGDPDHARRRRGLRMGDGAGASESGEGHRGRGAAPAGHG